MWSVLHLDVLSIPNWLILIVLYHIRYALYNEQKDNSDYHLLFC